MGTLSRDTHPDAERRQIELLRRTPSWRGLELAVQMTQACYPLALTGLKHGHPEALFLAAWGTCSGLSTLREAVADGARGTSRLFFPTFWTHLTILEIARILRARRYTLTLLSQME
jgi:hypothetical protein